MFISYTILSALLALTLFASAYIKLDQDNERISSMMALGVPRAWFPRLAILEILGAVGLLAGIFYAPFGVAAGVGVSLYFVGAFVTHLRVKDFKGAITPVVILALAVIAVALAFGVAD